MKKVIEIMQKAARCWAGYEPVPGAKAYSEGSCRPKGSKKTQKEMKNGDKEKKAETGLFPSFAERKQLGQTAMGKIVGAPMKRPTMTQMPPKPPEPVVPPRKFPPPENYRSLGTEAAIAAAKKTQAAPAVVDVKDPTGRVK